MIVSDIIYLLDNLNIHIIDNKDIVYHDNNYGKNYPSENYYAIRTNERNKWEFCFVQTERRSIPEYRTSKIFDTKEQAVTYFFLDRIRDYFMYEYIQGRIDFKANNWNIQTVLEKMEQYIIPTNYFSYMELLNNNSIYYFKKEGNYYNAFLGSDKIIVKESPELESQKEAFISTFKRINLLFYLDQYVESNIRNRNQTRPFTDMEKAEYLNYDS